VRTGFRAYPPLPGELARYPPLLYNTGVDLGVLKAKLDWLESRLQSIFEGGAARILSVGNLRELPASVVTAMRSGLQYDAEGVPLAPDMFILRSSPEDAAKFEGNPAILLEIESTIEQAGEDAGFRFPARPRVRIDVDPALPPGQSEILVQISQQNLEETGLVGLSPEEVEKPGPPGAFLILDGAQVYPLDQAVINIGRQADNHLVINDPRVSRTHAQIRAIKGRFVIFDLESSGGTYVNGVRTGQRALFPGDVISLAGVCLVYGQETGYLADPDAEGTQPITPFPPSP
jgi:hypothetical protein